jgi:hypothetical protein
MMKYLLFILLLSAAAWAQDFVRDLPKKEFIAQITSTNFPGSDAVILIKEQSLKVENSEVRYRGYELGGLSRQNSYVKIIKILNEAAVARYGTFEYSYPEIFGDEIPSGFSIKARVLKESGKTEIVPEKEIHKIVSLTNKRNEPLERKVIMKIPNLSVGDVLQIEYHHNLPFSTVTSGLFFYQDRDPVLFSNVYVTLPSRYSVDVFSFPEDKIGKPAIEQVTKTFGGGKTYFWSVRNCNSIPDEPYSFPFEDISYLTGFVVKEMNGIDCSNWINLVMNYYDEYIDRDNLNSSFYKDSGIPSNVDNADAGLTDSLYSTIKRNFRVRKNSEIYPARDISDVIELKKGDATDLSFIMYKVLKKWGLDANMVLIRDKRQGSIETSFPSLMWFDRAGVMVKTDGKEKIYDFDGSVQNNYELPWYLNGVNIYVVNKSGGYFKKLQFPSSTEHNQVVETHYFTLRQGEDVRDSMIITYKGSFAERLRGKYYNVETEKIETEFQKEFPGCFSTLETFNTNDFYENSSIDAAACGISVCNVEEVDSFLIIRPQEVVLSRLRNNIFSTARKNHIQFDAPFRCKVEFNIPVPEGYEVKSVPANSSFTTPFNGVFSMTSENRKDCIKLTGVLRIPQNVIEVIHFYRIIELFESSIKDMNREIVFKKI